MAANFAELGIGNLSNEYRVDLVDALWSTLSETSPELTIDIPPAMASFKIGHLSVDERIQLAQDIWDSLPADYIPPLSEAQKAELDRRFEEYQRSPESAITLEEFRMYINKKLQQLTNGGPEPD